MYTARSQAALASPTADCVSGPASRPRLGRDSKGPHQAADLEQKSDARCQES